MLDCTSPLDEILELLVEDGLIEPDSAVLTPLNGGVSCDVVKVVDGDSAFVVKRALAKLKVEADWFADVGRNKYEHRYLSLVDQLVPGAVPRVIHFNDDKQFFCMELLEGDWKNWKTELLDGNFDLKAAIATGTYLGMIHRMTRDDEKLAAEFATDQSFFELRLDPYLITTGKKHDNLRSLFEDEAGRIANTKVCLVHGDYSPKNILIGREGIKILDCEVAWYGDPAFDLAFLLNHLLLKSMYHAGNSAALDHLNLLFATTKTAYFKAQEMGNGLARELDFQTARLLLMLLLARVDGKSPVEYLSDAPHKQDIIRKFVSAQLLDQENRQTLQSVSISWFAELREQFL